MTTQDNLRKTFCSRRDFLRGTAALALAGFSEFEITNINGSGIGLGHPVGATGARIMVTLIHALKQKNKSLGLATLCGGGGVSMACAIEIL